MRLPSMKLRPAAAASLALALATGHAAPINPAEIGKTLTAAGSSVGAEGQLPRYEGNESQQTGWVEGKNRLASWKHRDDKLLYTIDASNVAKYASQLSPGQLALFKTIPDYKMDVYPTRRTCGFPTTVIENSKRNVTEAKLSEDGNSMATGVLPAVPFPGTQSGLEAIWNHLLRYSGLGIEIPVVRTLVSPRAGSDGWIDATSDSNFYYPLNKLGANKPTDQGGVFTTMYFKFSAPAALMGQAGVTVNAFGRPADSYFYFPGQRRVRRMPSNAYDAPALGFENQATMDSFNTYFGNPDRFDWKLVGEKEMIIPYNSFNMFDTEWKISDVVGPKSFTQKARRYEAHKVYVVEANVKQGMRHTMPKRTFYLDVDTYLAVAAEDYDSQGKILKVRESYPAPIYELDNTCVLAPYVQYDVQTGRFYADGLVSEAPANRSVRFFKDSNEPRYKLDYYTQDNLRALSER